MTPTQVKDVDAICVTIQVTAYLVAAFVIFAKVITTK